MLSVAFTLLLACGITWATVDAVVSPQIRTISERVTVVVSKIEGLEAWSKTQAKVQGLLESGRVSQGAHRDGLGESERQIGVAAEQVKGIER